MKINYYKSKVLTIGIGEEEIQTIANAFNCKVGKFPMIYLGLPISHKRLTKEELSESAGKIERRLDTWKCNQLSYGDRSILINSCLTSIPMYTMGFYWLHEGTQKMFDSARGRFFGKELVIRRNITW